MIMARTADMSNTFALRGDAVAASLRVLVAHDIADPSNASAPSRYLQTALSSRLEGVATAIAPGMDLVEAASICDALVLGAQPFGERELGPPARLALRVVARHGAGFDTIDLRAMTRAGVLVTNAPHSVRRPVALMAVTFILALAQKLVVKDQLTREGRWHERGRHIGPGVTGKMIGIVGGGGVGLETARLCQSIGLNVIFARSPRNDDLAARGFALAPLDEMLAVADFVVMACRLNEETRHMINADRLQRMSRSAYLVNIARGAVVDETALIAALQGGVIAGAGLDVFEQEPVDPSNPLLRMENVIVSPHHLCVTEETLQAIADEVGDSLAQIAAGREPANLVNPEVLDHPRVQAWLKVT